MDRIAIIRKILKALAGVVALGIVSLAGVVIFIGSASTDTLRALVIHHVAKSTGRAMQIEGAVQVHLFERHPRLIAERVTIGNPPWMQPGNTAEIGELRVNFNLPTLSTPFGIRRMELSAATLHLRRDESGRANWQWTDPDKRGGKGPPFLHSLSMPNAHVTLDDARRHLQFDGTVSAQDAESADTPQPLQIEAAGQLNGRAMTASVNADPLATASRKKPYRFAFVERSSGSRLTGHGFLPKPFDFQKLETTFEAEGADLKDVYFLTGLTLIHSGAYRLSGKLTRNEAKFEYSELVVTTGQSDMRGTISVDTSGDRARLVADVESQSLHLSDLGAQAAPNAPKLPPAKPLLLSDTKVDLTRMRRRDAVVNYRVRSLEAGRVSLHAVAGKATIEHGIIVFSPLSAALPDGKVTGRVRIDVTHDRPVVETDLSFSDLQLSRFRRKGSPDSPLDGLLRGRVSISGQGNSIHEVGASATGTVTAVVPHGAMRASLAELTAIDLRGIGLALARDKSETPIRCAVASFQAHEGTLTSQSLVIDTEPVLIGGSGKIELDSEALDLVFNGQPKSLRLGRLRTPVTLHGTLSKPSFGIKAGHSMAQAGGAVALGLVLTPLAAVLAFVDPGLAKDANCAALIAAPAGDPKH